MATQNSSAPLMLGVSGLRGIVGQSLTPDLAARYAASFGAWLRERGGSDAAPRVVLARDGRAGGEAVELAAAAGLLGAGCDVLRLGMVTTPTAGLAAEDADGGIIVTASHNPAEWNGLKCLVAAGLDLGDETRPYARAPFKHEAQQIIDRFNNSDRAGLFAEHAEVGDLEDDATAAETHIAVALQALTGLLPESMQDEFFETGRLGIRSVVDAVNSSGATIGVPFLNIIGEVVPIHCLPTGVFPHTPEPTKDNLSGPSGLTSAVPALGADVGFAQDPDADRLAIVDERGRYIGEEYTLAIAALSLLEALGDDARGTVFVANLSTSRMIDDVAAHFGARVERTPVGEANVVERMARCIEDGDRVVLGGEGNGGVIWPEIGFVRDSLGAMVLVVAAMARNGQSVSELVGRVDALSANGGGYAIEKRKVDLAAKSDAEPAVTKLAEWAAAREDVSSDTQDGIRLDIKAPDGSAAWVHVRASNTEPIMRLIAEAPTADRAAALLDEVAGVIG